jgi:glutamate--cysteine ligase
MGDLGYISKAQDDLNISYNSIEEYCSDLKNALVKTYEPYEKIGEFIEEERVQLNTSVIQIENEYYSTIRPKRVCPSGERPINILNSEGIDYLELRCVDLNPYSSIGITEDQINFLDTLLIYCFVADSPAISLEESSRIQRNHEKVVNEGRDEGALLETADGSIPLKEEANKLLLELEIVAEFMDREVFQDQNINWLPSIADQKENLLTPNGTLSGQVLKDLKDEDLSFRDLGNKMSNLHQNTMTSEISNLDELFLDASKKSLEDTKNIESSNQTDFEDYLKEFLEKIS